MLAGVVYGLPAAAGLVWAGVCGGAGVDVLCSWRDF